MNAFIVAKKLEKDASDLYSNLARNTRASSLRALITDLAADHQTRYHTLNALTGSSACPSDDSKNLRSLAKTVIEHFLKMQCGKNREEREDLEASVRTILELESTTAEFYCELKNLASSSGIKGLLQQLIDHGQYERFMVEEFYEFVNAPNEYLADAEFSNLDEFHQFGRQIG
jgi:rubrerythrin